MIRQILQLLERREYGNKIKAKIKDVKNIEELSDNEELEKMIWDNTEGWYELGSNIFKIKDGSAYFVTNLRADFNWDTRKFDIVEREKTPYLPKEAYTFTKKSKLKKNKKPIVFYHGTDAEFKKFSNNFEGRNFSMGNFWGGMYFSEIKDDARIFGKDLKLVVINAKKPLWKASKDFQKIYDAWEQTEGEESLQAYILSKGYDTIVHHSKRTGLKTEVIVFDPDIIMTIETIKNGGGYG